MVSFSNIHWGHAENLAVRWKICELGSILFKREWALVKKMAGKCHLKWYHRRPIRQRSNQEFSHSKIFAQCVLKWDCATFKRRFNTAFLFQTKIWIWSTTNSSLLSWIVWSGLIILLWWLMWANVRCCVTCEKKWHIGGTFRNNLKLWCASVWDNCKLKGMNQICTVTIQTCCGVYVELNSWYTPGSLFWHT